MITQFTYVDIFIYKKYENNFRGKISFISQFVNWML